MKLKSSKKVNNSKVMLSNNFEVIHYTEEHKIVKGKLPDFYLMYNLGYKFASDRNIRFYFEIGLWDLIKSFNNLYIDKLNDKYYVFCCGVGGPKMGRFLLHTTDDEGLAKECAVDLMSKESSLFNQEILFSERV